ncbi:MAG TPA: glutamine-hydrolyzing GMP synthase [Candidatus Binatia bacterium]|nr:glutamine-hydrolyzing GMP synthase [Candidatus Binatia bacterium]
MILVLDFGSQYTQLIARRVREAGVYCEIHPFHLGEKKLTELDPEGLILSGGPASVYDADAPKIDAQLLDGRPVLGICYGMGLLTQLDGGRVARAERREYGPADLLVDDDSDLFAGLDGTGPRRVWMSHGDRMESLPRGYQVIAHSANSPIAAIRDQARRRFGLQFHPEVVHTPQGAQVLRNFLFRVCGCKADWTMEGFVEREVAAIRARVGGGKVICALSGGVDSTVTAALVQRAIGDRLICVFVDNGLLRKNEFVEVTALYREHFGFNLRAVDASAKFLKRLRGEEEPERKRKIIGVTFIEVFEEEARSIPDVRFLAQGTLYPDVIESVSFKGPSATIKSHHNVGGLPERMHLSLIEPLRELFKDEVRKVGAVLGIPDAILHRQPFPGPGLAIRVLGEVTEERLAVLREADAIVREEIAASAVAPSVWQSFAVLLPVKAVGVMGDERTYDNVIAIRAVESVDGMTADWARLPYDLLARISSRITNEVRGVNRVTYDVSSKPPATIEWE